MDEYKILEGKLNSAAKGTLHIVSPEFNIDQLNGSYERAGTMAGITDGDFRKHVNLVNGKWTHLFSYIPLVVSKRLREPNSEEIEEIRSVEQGLEALCKASTSIDPNYVKQEVDIRALFDAQMVSADVYLVRVSPGHHQSQSYGVVTRPNEGPINLEDGKIYVGSDVALDLSEVQRHIDHKSSVFYRNNNEIVPSGKLNVHRKTIILPNLVLDEQRNPSINHRLRLLEKR